MRVVGISELLRRAQDFIGDDPLWSNVLGEERRGTLTLYEYALQHSAPEWQGYYMPWARVSPVDANNSLFVLAYYRDTRKWQDLEVAGHLEDCLQAVKDNVYGVFFHPELVKPKGAKE